MKRKKMRTFRGWATVTDRGCITWHDGKAVGAYASRLEANRHCIKSEGDSVVRVEIREVPEKRKARRSKK